MMTTTEKISSDFPFESKYVDVLGSKIHYVDEGSGDPMLFLHGVPTSNYVWRNIIPILSQDARCIAPDLIGMGKSDKPDIGYSIFDHIRYIEAFIEALQLKNITLVLHGWGSLIGFHYAMNHQENIKGIVFYESHVRPTLEWDMLSLPVQQFASLFSDEQRSYEEVIKNNFFIKTALPSGVLRKLSDEEMIHYSEPYSTHESRKPLLQYVHEFPVGNGPNDVVDLIKDYSNKLKQSNTPKLMFYAVPGFITTIDTVQWAKDNLSHLEAVDLGEAMHFVQETNPKLFGNELLEWYREIS